MRRRTMIDDYLDTHNPVPRATTDVVAPAPRRREGRRRVGVVMAIGATAAATGVALAFGPIGLSGPLSTEKAVAAAADDLQTDGILEWRTRSRYATDPNASRHATTTTTWTDLKSGAQHSETEEFAYRAKGKLVDDRFYAWRTPEADWSARAPKDTTDPIDVTEYERGFLGVGMFGTIDSPVGYIREGLDRAERGDAEVTPADPVEGVPVVRVTVRSPRQDPASAPAAEYLSLWITKEDAPRLVRLATEMRCPSGAACDRTPDDGRPGVEPLFETETLTWTVHPRSEEALSEVAVPTNDARFRLVPRER